RFRSRIRMASPAVLRAWRSTAYRPRPSTPCRSSTTARLTGYGSGWVSRLTSCSKSAIAEDDMPSVNADDLTHFAVAAYEAAGSPREHAGIVATHQVGANLVGHDSHGVVLLPTYIDRIKRGHIVPAARPEILVESPTTLAVNGRWGFGPVISEWTMERLVAKAREMRIAAGTNGA